MADLMTSRMKTTVKKPVTTALNQCSSCHVSNFIAYTRIIMIEKIINVEQAMYGKTAQTLNIKFGIGLSTASISSNSCF